MRGVGGERLHCKQQGTRDEIVWGILLSKMADPSSCRSETIGKCAIPQPFSTTHGMTMNTTATNLHGEIYGALLLLLDALPRKLSAPLNLTIYLSAFSPHCTWPVSPYPQDNPIGALI